MRIAHISDCYPPRLGGIETQVHGLASRQAAAGHEVTVFTATPGRLGERHGRIDRVDGVTVHRLAMRLPFDLPVNPFAPKDMRALLLVGRYDVAHIHAGVVSPFAYDAVPVVLDLRLPTVVTWHCMLGHSEWLGRRWARLRHWSERPAAFTCVSDGAAQPLRRIVGPDVPITVLPNGVDVDAWRAPARPASDGVVRLVSALRFAPRKRPIALVRMVTEARRRISPSVRLRLRLLGAGPQRALIEAQVRARRASSWIDLPGRMSHEQMLEIYADSDVYLAPALLESFGIAAIEARAAGLPVIGRTQSGIREFVTDGREGLLAEDDDALVDAIVRLATDPALRQRISAHNRSSRPSQDWPRVLDLADGEYRRAARIRAAA